MVHAIIFPFFYGFSVSPRCGLCFFSVTTRWTVHIQKRRGDSVLLLVPPLEASRIAHQVWTNNVEAPRRYISYTCAVFRHTWGTLKDRHRDTYIPTGHSPLLCFRLDPELCENSKRSKPKRQVNAFSKYVPPPFARPLAGNRRESRTKLVINIQLQNKMLKKNLLRSV